MKNHLFRASVCLASLLAPAIGAAATIIDTLPIADNGGWGLSSSQWLAAEFDWDTDYLITDIEGWVRSIGRTGQQFTITVYGDGGSIPDSNSIYYSNQAIVTGDASSSWEGYHISSGNGLALDAGTYWLGFEVRGSTNGDDYSGLMPGTAADPLNNYAVNFTGSWGPSVALDLGVRISGNPSPVPLPPAVFMFAPALLGMIAIRRRAKGKEDIQ